MDIEKEIIRIQEELTKLKPVQAQQEKQLMIVDNVYVSICAYLRELNDAYIALNVRKEELVEVLERNKDELKVMIDNTPSLQEE